jgi:peptide/nickel transport system substrate-binding protein
MVKPMPGNPAAPSLAESWSVSKDGLVYEFVLRKGARFHNGDPVTGEDVKFSFERYRGTANKTLKDRVAAVEVPDPGRVRFRMKQPWPDFLTFYASASGAGWIVPKKYVEKVGDEGFKKAPVGAGPYKFVSFNPGVGAVDGGILAYWRKTPASATGIPRDHRRGDRWRHHALKRGEVDYRLFRARRAAGLQRTPGLTLKPAVIQGTFWLYFPTSGTQVAVARSPGAAAGRELAMDRPTINQALTLGHSKLTRQHSSQLVRFLLAGARATSTTPRGPKQLLTEAGYPTVSMPASISCTTPPTQSGQAITNNLQAVGIR